MSAYKTDEEQLESLKNWWKEHGRSIITGAILGCAIIFGWQGWQAYQANQGEAASTQFDRLTQQIGTTQSDDIKNTADQITTAYDGSVYATLTRLQQAKQAYAQDDKAAAREHLQQAVENTSDDTLRALVKLRLVDLLIDTQAWQAAQQLLDAVPEDAPYAGEFAIRRGDLARQAGEAITAREAYQEALEKTAGDQRLVRMKLDELENS